MKLFLLWGLLLVIQNGAFTAVSRARNSGSDLYHAIASVPSNGIWFLNQVVLIKLVWQPILDVQIEKIFFIGIYYVVCTVVGAVTTGHLLRRYVERGKRRVGAY